MTNSELAAILKSIGEMLEIKGDNPFKVRSYYRAAQVVEDLADDINEIHRAGGLLSLPGIGEGIAKKIGELLDTGRLKYLDALRREIPQGLLDMLRIPGMGPKTVKLVSEKLSIKDIDALWEAASAQKLRDLPRLGAKIEENILRGIEFLRRSGGRMLLGKALPMAEKIVAQLKKVEGTETVEPAGSLRRRKETIGDLDLLAVSADPAALMGAFVSMPDVKRIIAQGTTKSSVLYGDPGVQVDLRVVERDGFGAALQYFTGSKEHNIRLRELASRKGLKLSEYGVFRLTKPGESLTPTLSQRARDHLGAPASLPARKGFATPKAHEAHISGADEPRLGGRDEAEVYRLLGLDYIPPELREDRGEIEAARLEPSCDREGAVRNRAVVSVAEPSRDRKGAVRDNTGTPPGSSGLPRLITRADIRGDLHVHSDWTDGRDSIETIAKAALALGYKYIAITDHTRSMAMVGGLTDARILQQRDKIRRLNDRLKGIKVLAGTECDIRADGTLDVADKTLVRLDIVVASIHSRFRDSKEVMTRRIVRALENEHVDILAHPTGRLIGEREAYEVDIDAVFEAAKRHGKALELNSFPDRLDLNDVLCRKAKEMRIPIAISTDSHSAAQLAHIEYGVATARRGWLEAADVVNTRDKMSSRPVR